MIKREDVLNYRKQKLTYKQIGEIFGVSRQRVHGIVAGYKSTNGRDRNRTEVRIRDNYICQFCGKKWIKGTINFVVHHIDCDSQKTRQYDRPSEYKNLITLCHDCHNNFHSKRRRKISPSKRKEYYRKYYFEVKKPQKALLKLP